MDAFRNRVAVITGGASGIGAAMARTFAARGAKIVLADIDEQGLGAMERELASAGTPTLSVPTDVTQRASVSALADATWRRFGAAHIVCNNAGIAILGEIAKAPHEDWEFTMNVDFWGVVHGVEAFVPRLIDQHEGGHVVNTASMAGLVGMQWLGIYCAAKFAVVGLTEALHRELKPYSIGASVLCPMIVATKIGENSQRLRPGAERPEREAAPSAPPAGAMRGGTVSAESVAAKVARGIERQDLYILTHPEQREILRRRAARIDAVFETWASDDQERGV
ncbi:MAG TPA: SDR family NAD(P)-dependent oxidoreductase [Myxococcota bacterium]|nr:SDR family NAD(P)-dependent oxidoreductase [Myxococcota bacterium]